MKLAELERLMELLGKFSEQRDILGVTRDAIGFVRSAVEGRNGCFARARASGGARRAHLSH